MIYYKLKLTDDKVVVLDIVDKAIANDGFIYATKAELAKFKDELLDISNITFNFDDV